MKSINKMDKKKKYIKLKDIPCIDLIGGLIILGLMVLFSIGTLAEKLIIVFLVLIYWEIQSLNYNKSQEVKKCQKDTI